jgi:hypothetical protein
MCYPSGLSIDGSGSFLYVADTNNYRIRRVDLSSGYMSTVAGSGSWGYSDGIGTQATFMSVQGIVVDSSSSRVFVADSNNNRIRMVQISTGSVSTLAGSGSIGATDGVGTSTSFYFPIAIALDPTQTVLLVLDQMNNRIRMIVLSSLMVTTLSPSVTFVSNPSYNFVVIGNGILADSSGQGFFYTSSYSITQVTLGSGARNVPLINSNSTSFLFSSLQGIASDVSRQTFYVSDNTGLVYRVSFSSPCLAGSYCTAGTASPLQCPAGTYCPTGSSAPTVCSGFGSFCPAGTTGPALCASGFFCPNVTVALQCPAGSYCTSGLTGSLSCNSTSGVYCGAGSSSQSVCSLGYYCPSITTQIVCPAGQYCGSVGLTAPSGNCNLGVYCPAGSLNAFGSSVNSSGTLFPCICLCCSFLILVMFQGRLSFLLALVSARLSMAPGRPLQVLVPWLSTLFVVFCT